MKLKVCTKAELLGLEKILFEKDLSLDTYIRFMNKVKDNFLEHTNVIEKMKEQPFYRLEYFLEEPSTGDYINDINNYFKRYMLIRGGVYRGDAKTCKIDRNLAVSMYDIMVLRNKRSKSWFRKKLLTNSQIEKIEASGQWKKILGDANKKFEWKSGIHYITAKKWFLIGQWNKIYLARKIYKMQEKGKDYSLDLS